MITKTILRVILLAIVFFANSVRANEYYVNASTGNDTNTGSENQPWKTIQKAANSVVAGDTVFIMAGTYMPNQKIEPLNSGTADNYINYLAFPGDEQLAIIDGSNILLPNWFGVFSISSKNFIKVSGLQVRNSSYAGIFIEDSTHIVVENNHTYQTYSSGISAWNCDTIIIDNNEVRRACWPTDGNQECISISGTNHIIVKNNHVYDGGSIGFGGGGEGIDIKDGCTNAMVHDNLVHDIASVGIYIDSYLSDQAKIKVFNNTVHNIKGTGITAASEEGGALENVIISNNTVYNCDDRGLVIHWTDKPDYLIKNIYVQHNTFFENGEGLDIGVHSLGENIHIANNIFSQNQVYQMQNSSEDLNQAQLHIKNNLFDGDNPSWALFGDDFIEDDPKFEDASSNNFHLPSTSPAVNKGVFLTETVNSGTGTTINLKNAGFFSDGYDIEQGDIIQFKGQTQAHEIIDIDYIQHTITLNETITWNIGDGVSLAYNDETPDIGAFEYGGTIVLPTDDIDSLTIYPNPANDIVNVSEKYINDYYQIISLTGSIVRSRKIISPNINISGISTGVYLFRIMGEDSKNILITKLIIE